MLIFVVSAFLAFFGWEYFQDGEITSNLAKQTFIKKEKPLEKYTYDFLSNADFKKSKITLGEILADEDDFTSRVFYFFVNNKKVSGLINIPKAEGVFPIVLMFRGYVDREIYKTGMGTQRAGEVFAQNGFITIAPDFLGYGESDNPSEDPIEERFQTYVTALTLFQSIGNINETFEDHDINVRADTDKVGIWGHSNGGQIALSVLEITGKDYPTVLWAPVSKPFPYSVLYYTDEFDDRGKMLRRVIAKFEEDYDVEDYNLTNFYEKINAPIQIHQGTADDAVPLSWSDQLVERLEELEKDTEYFTYSGSDHNLLPGGWSTAVNRSIFFFGENL